MIVNELLHKSRNTLQDQEKNFWDDSELLDYYEEGRRVIASERTDKLKTQTVVLNAGDDYYAPIGVLRYTSCKDDTGLVRPLYPNDDSGVDDINGITIIDFDQIKVHDDTVGSTLLIKYIGLPEEHNLNDSVRQGDETALRYFICARAYEKETDMENFSKSEKFEIKFNDMVKELTKDASTGYNNRKANTTASYFY